MEADRRVRYTTMICLAAGLMSAFCPHGAALADAGESRFTVSATVPVLTDVFILEAPSPMLLSAEDVTRGYKIVSARYRVSSNAKGGYLLQLTPRTGLVRRIEITGLGADLTVHDEAVEVLRRPTAASEEIALQLRLLLRPAVAPGRHVFPLHVTAVPL